MASVIAVALIGALSAGQTAPQTPAATAEVFQVTAERVGELPEGDKADGAAGDWVLRNDKVVAVVAGAKPARGARPGLDDAAGVLLDFSRVNGPGDRLTAFVPGGDRRPPSNITSVVGDAGEAILVVEREPADGQPLFVAHSFSLAPGDRWLKVSTLLRNTTDRPVEHVLADSVRCEGFAAQPDGYHAYLWCWDRPSRSAYGILPVGSGVQTVRHGDVSEVWYAAFPLIHLEPQQSFTISRRFLVGESPADLQGQAMRIKKRKVALLRGIVTDETGAPVADAVVNIKRELFETTALTNRAGGFSVGLEMEGKVVMLVSAPGGAPTKAIAWIKRGINERAHIIVPAVEP